MNLNNEIRSLVTAELEDLKRRIAENIVSTKRNASGKTAKSLTVTETNGGGILTGRKAFSVLETGRGGGKVPQGFAGIILQWMRDKGISAKPIPYVRQPTEKWQPKYDAQERGDRSMAGAIAHTIMTDGTELFRKGGNDEVYSQEIPKTIAAVREKLLSTMMLNVVEMIKLNTK